MIRRPPRSTLFPYTPLSRSAPASEAASRAERVRPAAALRVMWENTHEACARGPPACCTGGPSHDQLRNDTRRRSASSEDRKSTRLNSSHSQISYAVFCLKKKKKTINKKILK